MANTNKIRVSGSTTATNAAVVRVCRRRAICAVAVSLYLHTVRKNTLHRFRVVTFSG